MSSGYQRQKHYGKKAGGKKTGGNPATAIIGLIVATAIAGAIATGTILINHLIERRIK